MSPFKQALGNAKLAILVLLLSLMGSFILNLFLGFLLYRVPKDMTVFVPAHIPAGGLHTKADHLSDAQVYRFTYSTWISLNTWSGNGQKAYSKNLARNAAFLTTSFMNTLKSQMAQMNQQGFLYKHAQISFGSDGSAFNPEDVKYIGNDTWLVHLDIRTINYVNGVDTHKGFAQAHVASDAETSFVFKVTRFPIIAHYNTNGLVLAGFATAPKVLKVYE